MPKGFKGFQKGQKFTEEHKKRISKGRLKSILCKGIVPWNKGKHISTSGSFQKGNKHRGWKGGKTHQNYGYILIYKPNHPYRDKSNYILEHRLVMEQILGRYLTKNEWVHHKNGIKDDNRPENLILTVLNKNWHPQICPKCSFEFLIK